MDGCFLTVLVDATSTPWHAVDTKATLDGWRPDDDGLWESWRERSTITVEEAAPILGIGRSSAYVLARCGGLPTLELGRRKVVPVAKLRRMLGEILNDYDPPANEAVGKARQCAMPQQKRLGAGGWTGKPHSFMR